MGNNADDVFIWKDFWCYRDSADYYIETLGQPDQILQTESPEWAVFMDTHG